MKLEQRLTNKVLSKRLKVLGVKQDSLWYWSIPEGGQDKDRFLSCTECNNFCVQDTCSWNHNYISAFTTSELGEMLPEHCSTFKDSSGVWTCDIRDKMILDDDSEVNARAKMLIYLLENKFIKL